MLVISNSKPKKFPISLLQPSFCAWTLSAETEIERIFFLIIFNCVFSIAADRLNCINITMKATIAALFLFSCIMCVQMTSTIGWLDQVGYAQLRNQPSSTPVQKTSIPEPVINATAVDSNVMKAATQISRGSEKFSFEFFKVCISTKSFTWFIVVRLLEPI